MSVRVCVLLLAIAWPGIAAWSQEPPAASDAATESSAVERELAAREAEDQASNTIADAIAVDPTADDDAIRDRIARLVDVIAAHRGFESVDVEVESGIVFLDGVVPTDQQRNFVGEIARNVEGVVYVDNGLSVEQVSPWSLEPAWAELAHLGGDAVRVLPFLLAGAAILAISLLIGLLLRRFASAVLGSRRYAPIVRNLLANLVLLAAVLVGLFLALRVTGLTRLALSVLGGTGLFGLVVGIAFRDIFENFLASLLISTNRPFTIGDLIEIGEHRGFVQSVTTRGTLLMTAEGDHIHVPNSVVYKATLRNLTSNPNRRFTFAVGIDYEDNPVEALQAIRDAVRSVDVVRDDPPPVVIVEELGASTVNIRGYYWVDVRRDSELKARSQVIRAVKVYLEAAGLTMPDEQREVIFPKGVPVAMQDHLPHSGSSGDDAVPPNGSAIGVGRNERILSEEIGDNGCEVDDDLSTEEDTIRRQAAQSSVPVGPSLVSEGDDPADDRNEAII